MVLQVSRMLEGVQSGGQLDGSRENALGRKALQVSRLRPKIFPEQLGHDAYEDALRGTTVQVIR